MGMHKQLPGRTRRRQSHFPDQHGCAGFSIDHQPGRGTGEILGLRLNRWWGRHLATSLLYRLLGPQRRREEGHLYGWDGRVRETDHATITIEVKGDNKKETHETFYVDLFDSSINALFTKFRGIGTILNDD